MTAVNIKNDEAVRMIKELAELKGKSMTKVIIEAVRGDLERERKPHVDESVVQFWIKRGREIRAEIERNDPESLNRDPFEDLYDDELGLPK